MTNDERWQEIEAYFDDISLGVEHRCYPNHSTTGAMCQVLAVRRHLSHIDKLLTEMAEKITISELGNTWGCAWEDNDGATHYGFGDCPISRRARLWLECAQGDAVRLLLEAGNATIVQSRQGAYGGKKRTVEVDVTRLEVSCDRYWDRLNAAAGVQQDEAGCHYCGQQASGTGFFGEPVCREC